MKRMMVLALLTALAGLTHPAMGGMDSRPPLPQEGKMKLESSDFAQGSIIPQRYTCGGENVSPHLEWGDAPAGTKSFALIVDDPDAPAGIWVHWLLYNIPGERRGLPENIETIPKLDDGILQGRNDFGKTGYGGPCPPHGHGPHRYVFKLYALDDDLELPPGAQKAALERAMQGHILAQAEIMGRYER